MRLLMAIGCYWRLFEAIGLSIQGYRSLFTIILCCMAVHSYLNLHKEATGDRKICNYWKLTRILEEP
jgi:hypothetical protein